MSESFVNVTEGSGKKLHANQRTIGTNDVHDEYTLPGEYALASYTIAFGPCILTTAASHLLQVMAGSTLPVRIRRIVMWEATPPATVAAIEIAIFRLTTAGTGGGAITPRPFDTADSAAGATAQTLPTAKGTEGVHLLTGIAWLGTAAIPTQQPCWEWVQQPNTKPIIIPAGTTNGIAIKDVPGIATATVYGNVEFVETSFV